MKPTVEDVPNELWQMACTREVDCRRRANPNGARHGVAPFQAAQFADADPGYIQKLQQNPVASFLCRLDQFGDPALFEDALGQVVAIGHEFRPRSH